MESGKVVLSIYTYLHTKHTNVDRWWQFLMSVVLFAAMELEADYA